MLIRFRAQGLGFRVYRVLGGSRDLAIMEKGMETSVPLRV